MEMVDLSHYVLKSSFTAWEISCLVAGVDPATANREDLEREPIWGKIKIVENAIAAARENARRTLFAFIDSLGSDAMIRDEVSLSDEFGLAPWEEGCNLPDGDEGYISCPYGLPCNAIFKIWYARETRLPSDLVPIEKALFSPTLVGRWLLKKGYKSAHYFVKDSVEFDSADEVIKLRARIAELESKREADTSQRLDLRIRETLLTLIIGLAVGGYGYDPKAKKSNMVTQFLNDLDRLGLSISDETVRKYLKEAANLLPRT